MKLHFKIQKNTKKKHQRCIFRFRCPHRHIKSKIKIAILSGISDGHFPLFSTFGYQILVMDHPSCFFVTAKFPTIRSRLDWMLWYLYFAATESLHIPHIPYGLQWRFVVDEIRKKSSRLFIGADNLRALSIYGGGKTRVLFFGINNKKHNVWRLLHWLCGCIGQGFSWTGGISAPPLPPPCAVKWKMSFCIPNREFSA